MKSCSEFLLALFYILLHATFPSCSCLRITSNERSRDGEHISETPETLAKMWRYAAQQFQEKHGHKQKLVFIGGPPRAGTTLIMSFLGKSSEVSFSQHAHSKKMKTTLEDWVVRDLPGMGSSHYYRECATPSFVSSEEVGRQRQTEAMAAMWGAGFNLYKEVLAMKVPPYAWGMRALQAMFNETHDVRFVVSVKNPLDVKPEQYKCSPYGAGRMQVLHNLEQCYKSLFENVLPHLNNYKVVRYEDWFLQEQLPLELSNYIGLQNHVTVKYKRHAVATLEELANEIPEQDMWEDRELICHDCGGSELSIDFKYFGVCQYEMQKYANTSTTSRNNDFVTQLGYHDNSVNDVSTPALLLEKA